MGTRCGRTLRGLVLTVDAAVLLLVGCFATPSGARPLAPGDPSAPPRVAEVSEAGWVTGENSPNRTGSRFRVFGTDLGIMWEDGHGAVLMAFGDTFGRGSRGHGSPTGSIDWRANTLGRTADATPSHGLALPDMVQDPPGRATEVIARDRSVAENTVNPTAAISVGKRQYLHYMSVRQWGQPGRWNTNYAGIAYSDDGGAHWTKAREPRWDNPNGTDGFQMGAMTRDNGHVYLFGKPNGRFGPASLARVPEDRVLDKSAYTYWNGSAWQPSEERAVPVFGGSVGELSVAYHPGIGRWIAMYLDERRGAIVLRTSPNLVGPWSQEQDVVNNRRYPGLYAPFIHPALGADNNVYFAMSQWDQYNVRFMRMRLQ
jgi:hypothetical protein